MNTLLTHAARSLIGAILLAASVPGQEPDAPPQPAEAVVVAKGLEGLVAEIDGLREAVQGLLDQARAATTPEEADALYGEVVVIGKRIAELAESAKALRAEANPLKARIDSAMRLPTAREAEAALRSLEREVDKAARGGDEDVMPLLGVVRYRLAEIMRQEAAIDLERNGSARPFTAWNQAAEVFAKVLDCPDREVQDIGSSIHAAALAKVVECKVTLYLSYAAVSPRTATVMGAMQRYEREARDAFARLRRSFPDKVQSGEGHPLDRAKRLIDQIK
ncbi:MAG: hypothetical protein R3F29_04625 [Planctomycetota bacterium]